MAALFCLLKKVCQIGCHKVWSRIQQLHRILTTTARINSAKKEVYNSLFFTKLIESLQNSKNLLPQSTEIVCYGIGQFSESVASRFQLALLILLKELLKSKVSVFDPILSASEIEIIKHFDCFIIDINEEGKRRVDCKTLFFIPHCPKQLVNNLLWKNWSGNISKCIIIGNSLSKVVESNSDRFLKENLFYVLHASSVVTEIAIDNCFKFSDIFNDLSIHYFLEKDIERLSDSILNFIDEPEYQKEDLEFIARSLSRDLTIS